MKITLSLEKGFLLKQGHFTKNSPFTKKGLFLFFIFLRVPMTSHSFCNLFSLHSHMQTIKSYMFVHGHQCKLPIQFYNAHALFSRCPKICFNIYLDSQEDSEVRFNYTKNITKYLIFLGSWGLPSYIWYEWFFSNLSWTIAKIHTEVITIISLMLPLVSCLFKMTICFIPTFNLNRPY
jgi:hypothetical protein